MKTITSCLFLFCLKQLLIQLNAFIMYDPDLAICCNGTIQQWEPGVRCCGTQSYKPSDQICCFGKLLPLPDRGVFGCCGTPEQPKVFPYGKKDCCHGEVVNVTEEDTYYGCCGQRVYYPERESCCSGIIQPFTKNLTCCGNETIEESKELCCQKKIKTNGMIEIATAVHPLVGDNQACCGTETFNWKQELCCGDEIYPRNQTVWCCGGHTSYDATTHICCHGKIYEKKNGYECCWTAGMLYNPDSEFCCDSEVVSVEVVTGNSTACCAANLLSRIYGPYGQ